MHAVARSQIRLGALVVAAALIVVAGCGDNGTGSAAPEIAGCNHVRYQGTTFNLGLSGGGCAPGVVSFTQSGSQNGVGYCFNVTCSEGCISSVTPCSGAQLQVLRDGSGDLAGLAEGTPTDWMVQRYQRLFR